MVCDIDEIDTGTFQLEFISTCHFQCVRFEINSAANLIQVINKNNVKVKIPKTQLIIEFIHIPTDHQVYPAIEPTLVEALATYQSLPHTSYTMLDLDSLNLLVPDPPLQETSQLQQLSISDDEQVDLDGDQLMDHGVQEDHIVSTTPMYLRNIQLLHQYQSQHLPHVSSPLRNSTFESSQLWPTSSNEEDDLMDVDCFDGDQEEEEEQNTSILGKSIVENVGLILSPTLLGAKVATQGNISLEANSSVEQEQQEEVELGSEKSQTRNSDDGRTKNQSSTHEETNESRLPETTNDSELLDEEEEEEENTQHQSNTNEDSFSTDSASSEQDSTTSGYSSSNYTRDS
ncbi:hypothetical protein WICPIJ_006447, partial [Wickerhamomyces pijperi]